MCVSFRCRYIRLEKLDKSSQDTLSLLVARSGTKRNRPPPSGKQAFRLRQPILLSAGGSKVSCSRFIQFLQAHTSTPERDATSLRSSPGGRSVVEVSTSSPSLEKFMLSYGLVVNEQAARFYKFASKVLWSRRHLTSWKRLPLGSQIPRSLVSAASDKQRKRACGELINLAAVRISTSP